MRPSVTHLSAVIEQRLKTADRSVGVFNIALKHMLGEVGDLAKKGIHPRRLRFLASELKSVAQRAEMAAYDLEKLNEARS